jgi:YVTN family beta-propeller protein
VLAGGFSQNLAASPDGRSVYVTNAASADVSQYDVDPNGRLTPKTPATVGAGSRPFDIAVSPSPLVPTGKEQCKNGGWRTYGVFKNQGDCVSFVATKGKNTPGSLRPR